jgi:hypothetical protein
MAKEKKSTKSKVPQSKLAAYWGWTYPNNVARRALRLFKRLNGKYSSAEAAGFAVEYCRHRDEQAKLAKYKPATLSEAAFQRVLAKHVDERLKSMMNATNATK